VRQLPEIWSCLRSLQVALKPFKCTCTAQPPPHTVSHNAPPAQPDPPSAADDSQYSWNSRVLESIQNCSLTSGCSLTMVPSMSAHCTKEQQRKQLGAQQPPLQPPLRHLTSSPPTPHILYIHGAAVSMLHLNQAPNAHQQHWRLGYCGEFGDGSHLQLPASWPPELVSATAAGAATGHVNFHNLYTSSRGHNSVQRGVQGGHSQGQQPGL
jgi:hypothetical protein